MGLFCFIVKKGSIWSIFNYFLDFSDFAPYNVLVVKR